MTGSPARTACRYSIRSGCASGAAGRPSGRTTSGRALPAGEAYHSVPSTDGRVRAAWGLRKKGKALAGDGQHAQLAGLDVRHGSRDGAAERCDLAASRSCTPGTVPRRGCAEIAAGLASRCRSGAAWSGAWTAEVAWASWALAQARKSLSVSRCRAPPVPRQAVIDIGTHGHRPRRPACIAAWGRCRVDGASTMA